MDTGITIVVSPRNVLSFLLDVGGVIFWAVFVKVAASVIAERWRGGK